MARFLERESLGGVAMLGAGGLVSAAALVLLASNRLPNLDAAQVTPMLLAIQWHMVGLTVAKFGIDYAIFAIVSRQRDATFRIASSLAFPVLPCLAAFAIATLGLFPPLQAALITLAVFADTLSTFRQAEFNAKRAFATSAAATLLNYPLFVIAWWVAAQNGTTLTEGLAAFAASSIARWAWFAARHGRLAKGARPVQLGVKGLIGTQGALNLLLFRFDQIVLSVALFAGAQALARDPQLAAYVFLARIPEFATGVLVLLGTVYFPLHPIDPQQRRPAMRFYAGLVAATAAGAALAAVLLVPAFAGTRPATALWIPFVAQVPLILLANLATYSMQSQGYLSGLVRNQAIACALGIAVIGIASASVSLRVLAWTVPAQLAIFFALCLAGSWGRPSAILAEARG